MKTKITYDLRVSPIYTIISLVGAAVLYAIGYSTDYEATNMTYAFIIVVVLIIATSVWFLICDIKKLHIANLYYILTAVAGIAAIIFISTLLM